MSSRRSTVQILVRLGLAGTIGAAFIGLAYYYWKKKRQEELRKKFLFDPVEEAGMELKEQILAMEKGQTGDANTLSPFEQNAKGLTKERLVTVNVRIPREHAKTFVGTFGNNVQKIQTDTGTNISSSRETLDNGDRLYVIKGNPSNVRMAELAISKFIMCQPIQRTVSIQVPASAMGRIIGRNGEAIRGTQDASKARITTGSRDEEAGYGESETTRVIKIRGTDDQISRAQALIQEQVDADEALRMKIKAGTTGRTKRRIIPANMSSRSESSDKQAAFSFKHDGTMEVFVSCVYNPNKFFIQVVGKSSIDLDKLCDTMTEFYINQPQSPETEITKIQEGDIVAASYELDNKIYRARVIDINGEDAMVVYVDFGEKRVVPVSKLHRIEMEHLKLPFQAIETTLNLDYNGEWSTEIVNEFCNLTDCAAWKIMTAKVKDYLKDDVENKTTIWVELYDSNQINIGDEINRRLGIGSETVSPSEGSPMTATLPEVQSIVNNGASSSYASMASKSAAPATNGSGVPS